ncbi:DUF3879 family protein [Sporosarcina limicola]|uniref:Uncharacterized protein n=1 Tax=Sporosarcina limicola TaxID=34101 RepID=A0A927MKA1_9BACL|nr:DUF3879 family protein [Sporosarcina limicola]MBE1554517.1 hypothetical protein [Sporosarcina limicola]
MKINSTFSQMNFATMSNLRQTVKFAQMKENVEAQSETRYPGIYDNDPMNITTRTGWKKIVPVSDKVKQGLINAARDSMENHGGMLNEKSNFNKIKTNYLNSLPKTERLSASYTLDQIFYNEAQCLVDFVREKNPSWDFGKPVKPGIIAEAYKSPGVDIKA